MYSKDVSRSPCMEAINAPCHIPYDFDSPHVPKRPLGLRYYPLQISSQDRYLVRLPLRPHLLEPGVSEAAAVCSVGWLMPGSNHEVRN